MDTVAVMDLLQLKAPPDRVRAIANALERDLDINPVGREAAQLRETLTWLRYRLALWDNRRHRDPVS